ncbi:MAG TPA: hypothetical protein VGO47_08155 [Chlamydiales bacterium]|nr:hypothetical protein [Chlamydiales bacterium]
MGLPFQTSFPKTRYCKRQVLRDARDSPPMMMQAYTMSCPYVRRNAWDVFHEWESWIIPGVDICGVASLWGRLIWLA